MNAAKCQVAADLSNRPIAGLSSAFKKWSGHVVQKGSRKGMFGYFPGKNLDSPRFYILDVMAP